MNKSFPVNLHGRAIPVELNFILRNVTGAMQVYNGNGIFSVSEETEETVKFFQCH